MDITGAPAPSEASTEGLAQVARWLLAPLLLGAGAIHLAMVPDHAQAWMAEGIAFALMAWAQLGLALLLVLRPSRKAVGAAAAVSAFGVGAWAVTRFVGYPFGPFSGATETVGAADLVTVAFEGLVVLGAALALVRAPNQVRHSSLAGFAAAIPVVAVLALTTGVLASPAGSHDDTHGDHQAAGDPHTRGGDHHPAGVEGENAVAEDHPHEEASEATGQSHSHGEPCTDPVTDEQQAAADALVVESHEGMDTYQDYDAAMADGYVNITPEGGVLVHYARFDLMQDDALLDPTAIESLMYFHPRDGSDPVLVGAMYFADPETAGPEIGGCLTQWHVHDNLCIAPGEGMVGVVDPEGSCPAGSRNDVTQEMLHVWDIDLPTGPFSELAEADRTEMAAAVVRKVAEQQTA